MNNKIMEVQEMLFNEMKRLSDDNIMNVSNKEVILEFGRATQLYNMSTGFIKALNSQLTIRNIAKREQTQYTALMKELGVLTDGK